ncbi:MAG: glucose-6-phosphate isomerase [Acidimicrobiales bacterium]|nr:glucose-6-phosphate isomerase [Acidimicrobiales bacterium]
MSQPLSTTPSWQALIKLRETGLVRLPELFASEPDRAARRAVQVGDLWIDLSRQHFDSDVLDALVRLAEERDVMGFLTQTITGEVVNRTEGLPAGHQTLRLSREESPTDVIATRDRMADLASRIRAGEEMGATGAPIRAVVNLGIGGSHLGPSLVADALNHLSQPEVTVRFSSGLDTVELSKALHGLEPATTLVVACSKSFTTVETLTALDNATDWLTDGIGGAAINHVIAVTAEADRARALGIAEDRIFDVPESVGGRFSVSSATGLSAMVAIGADNFTELLAGMRTVDLQAVASPVTENAAVLMALIDFWNRSVLGRTSLAVVPYAHGLRLLPAHLQQLSMESLGKRVTSNGLPTDVPTGAVIWGGSGTDAQHAFFQLLHQGTDVIPVDFIGVARPSIDNRSAYRSNDLLMANLAAQADALAFGRSNEKETTHGVEEQLLAYRVFPGDRPSTAILMPELTPSTLGQLIALYENRTVANASLLDINPFDQWGVELGKQMAVDVAAGIAPKSELLRRFQALRGS